MELTYKRPQREFVDPRQLLDKARLPISLWAVGPDPDGHLVSFTAPSKGKLQDIGVSLTKADVDKVILTFTKTLNGPDEYLTYVGAVKEGQNALDLSFDVKKGDIISVSVKDVILKGNQTGEIQGFKVGFNLYTRKRIDASGVST